MSQGRAVKSKNNNIENNNKEEGKPEAQAEAI